MKQNGLVALAALGLLCAPAGARPDEKDRDPDDVPACVDLVLIGHLSSRGDAIERPADPLGLATYSYAFDLDRPIHGAIDRRRLHLRDALDKYDQRNTVVFLQRTETGSFHLADSQVAWPDREGRLFLPLFWPPQDGHRRHSWLRDAGDRLARPVAYAERDLRRTGHDKETLNALRNPDTPGYIEKRHGRLAVLRGIYLEDIPAILALDAPGACWR